MKLIEAKRVPKTTRKRNDVPAIATYTCMSINLQKP
jgi:hypothetical protein